MNAYPLNLCDKTNEINPSGLTFDLKENKNQFIYPHTSRDDYMRSLIHRVPDK